MKYLEEDEQRNLEEYNTTTEEEIDSCEVRTVTHKHTHTHTLQLPSTLKTKIQTSAVSLNFTFSIYKQHRSDSTSL